MAIVLKDEVEDEREERGKESVRGHGVEYTAGVSTHA